MAASKKGIMQKSKFIQLSEIVIPSPRREFHWSSLFSLVLFLLLFSVTILSLYFSRRVIFSQPEAFWWTLVTPWFWWMGLQGYSGLIGRRLHLAIFTRLCLAGCFIMLLSDPRTLQENDGLTVMYAVDLSDSIGAEMRDEALMYMADTVTARPPNDEAGLLVFGSEAAIELPPRKSFPFERITSLTGLPKDGTDIEKALSLASAMIPEERNGRIVLVSDGTSTSGDINRVIGELQTRKIAVDVLPVDFSFDDEVWLEKLHLPADVKIGETYEASVILSSLKDGKGTLKLYENDELIYEEKINYKAGKNRYTMPLHLRAKGFYKYKAFIEPLEGKDSWQENNVAINSIFLQGKGKVLFVVSPEGDKRDWELLSAAVKEAGREVEVINAFELPREALSLLPYDCIIYVNIGADDLDPLQMKACRDAVYNQGSGFLMVGGENSYGPGGYHHTSIEEILPVDMDISNKKVMPKGALVVILHTCEFADGNTWAKEISKASIRVLSAQDDAGLLAWDGNDSWIFPLTSVSEYEMMVQKINNAEPADMPYFGGTMTMAFNALKASDAAQKHVIVISDGDPSPPTPQLLANYKAEGITISTVLVDGFHQGQFVKPMQLIAKSTGGRFYHPKNPKSLPSIFIKEAKTLKKSMIQNKSFVPRVEFSDGSILKGIDSLPPLHGYVLVTAKGDPRRCRTILRGPDKEQLDPILAVGSFGIGKSAAFTSDLSPRWGRDWLNWDKALPFIKQAIVSISRVSKEGSLRMSTDYTGAKATVIIEDFHSNDEFLQIVAKISKPDGSQADVELRQIAPRRYKASFNLIGEGDYQVFAIAKGATRDEQVVGGVVVPYSIEYLKFSSNMKDLEKLVQKTGGRMLSAATSGEEIFNAPRETKQSSQPFYVILLLVLACLIPLDVAIRRVQVDLLYFKEIFGSKKVKESTETMGALLQRKKSLRDQDENKKVPAPRYVPSPRPKRQNKPSIKPQSSQSEEPSVPEDSTTSRLLAMKNKRDKK
jgi:Ca-activated chloride channel homolog